MKSNKSLSFFKLYQTIIIKTEFFHPLIETSCCCCCCCLRHPYFVILFGWLVRQAGGCGGGSEGGRGMGGGHGMPVQDTGDVGGADC